MNRLSRTPQLLIALAATLTLVTTAPYVQAQLAAVQGDVYVVKIQNEEPFQLRADRILRHQSGYLALERDDQTVAIFSGYQVTYVVNQTVEGANTYEVKSQDGTFAHFRADNIRTDQQGFVELTVDGQLKGIIRNQVLYVRMVDADN